eukprot:IDg15524t1
MLPAFAPSASIAHAGSAVLVVVDCHAGQLESNACAHFLCSFLRIRLETELFDAKAMTAVLSTSISIARNAYQFVFEVFLEYASAGRKGIYCWIGVFEPEALQKRPNDNGSYSSWLSGALGSFAERDCPEAEAGLGQCPLGFNVALSA